MPATRRYLGGIFGNYEPEATHSYRKIIPMKFIIYENNDVIVITD